VSGYNGIPVPTQALWTWTAPVSGAAAQVVSFPTVQGAATKTGLTPVDLQNYMGTPIVNFGPPPVPIDPAVITGWIRQAEDDVETVTNIRLCQTWIAAPAAKTLAQKNALNLAPESGTMFQQLGIDFDYEEPGYDFLLEKWRDESWGFTRLRCRPVKSVSYYDPGADVGSNATGMKNVAFIYPLLNEYFRMPNTWFVEDQNRGLIRFVPATSVQMLPLFAMQLAFMGFAQSVPQGLWFQYTAGLTAADYASDWSFMKQLVLARASITAWQSMQFSINFGAVEVHTIADGLSQRIKFSEKGPLAAQIANQQPIVDALMKRAKSKTGGFAMGML
jgi:hypothetical protein